MDSRPDLLTHQIDLTGIPLAALCSFSRPELNDAIARMMSKARHCPPGEAVQEQR
jgi:hypothetical protein